MFSKLELEVIEEVQDSVGKQERKTIYPFTIPDMQHAVMVLNTICSHSRDVEPTLYLVAPDGTRMLLNNRLDFNRAVQNAARQAQQFEIPTFPVGR